ncbi:hypothetical protein PQX77_013095 [Marasmius sp. AFHP31]|nr:hypothetical protein PQX77_013095 [Marasmius sp. AFHP31]
MIASWKFWIKLTHPTILLLEQLSQVVREADGLPKIQKIRVVDLPQELIYHLFAVAELQEARCLASTCKASKRIGTSPYLYRTRSLILRFGDDYRPQLDQGVPEFLDKIATETSQAFISLTQFLASRPEITHLIQTLRMIDRWQSEGGSLVPSFLPYVYEKAFYDSIHVSITPFLSSCLSLTDLTICRFIISGEWFGAISQLANLHTIHFLYICIEDEFVEHDILYGIIPSCPHVLNVDWTELGQLKGDPPSRESTGDGLWYTLLLFPNLKTFNRTTRMYNQLGATWLPSSDVQQMCDMFCKSLQWITSSRFRTSAACTLTHLKLRTYHPVPDHLALPLLDALGSAPLVVLVLEGLQQGSLTLLERIVQLFPDLVGLTLTREDTRMQREQLTTRITAAVWPHQSGEYASRFQGFRRLRYFGWNFSSEGFDYRYSPATLEVLESSALAERAGYESELQRGEEDDFREDDWSVARVFGCYCPSLEVVMFEGQPTEPYLMSRGTRYVGDVIAYCRQMGSGREWNPDSVFHQGWKTVDSNEDLVEVVL